MKKIAIFTIQSMNYGNRLQNYASSFILKNLGYDVCTLRTKSPEEIIEEVLSRKPKFKVIKCFIPMLKRISQKFKFIIKRDRSHFFEEFDKKISMSKDYIGYNDYSVGKYDAIIVGSDQIWNTTFDFISNNCFLPFDHPCKVAFSASFGIENIPYNQEIVDCLKDFIEISVREEAGAKIVKNLADREATVLVDPTMLLTQDEWRKVAKKPKGAKNGYILTYFLSPKCEQANEKLEKIKNGREVYELLNSYDKVAGTAGPAEFLWLFDNADLILTDSFHACVFSFLFNKPFIVYDRNWKEGNMNSRLETLLTKFSLERKYANSDLENDIWEHEYAEGYKQLNIEREKAINFLKKALEK